MASTSKPQKVDVRSWENLSPPLPGWLLDAVASHGWQRMTPVQAAVIPSFRRNTDVVVEAVTGSGKTLSFLIPVIDRVLRSEDSLKRHNVTGIIISPTRELAEQTYDVLVSQLLSFHQPSADILPLLKSEDKRPSTTEAVIVPQLLVGGSTTVRADLSFFARHSPNVLIGTPGRLAELLVSPHVHTSNLEVLIMDEADRLLDQGFKPQLGKILGILPKQRRTGLFSASMSEAVRELIVAGLRNPQRIKVTVKSLKDGGVIEERKTPASLRLTYMVLKPSHKFPAIAQLLRKIQPPPLKTIIFLNTCDAVKYFTKVLPAVLTRDFKLLSLHGKLEPPARQKNFSAFVSSSSPTILICTDIAARGLDIPQVDLVIQDPPQDPKTYLHRAGRAGRAGRKGLSVLLLLPGQEAEGYIHLLDIKKTPVELLVSPEITVTDQEAQQATDKIRAQVLADREVYNLSLRAFPSFVRSYSEHRTQSIFRVQDLDWNELAAQFGLVRLPRMPELGPDFDRALGLNVDIDTIPFKDKAKEKQRQKALAEAAANAGDLAAQGEKARVAALEKKKRRVAWSGKAETEEVKRKRREKKDKKRVAARWASLSDKEKEEQKKVDELVRQVRAQNGVIATAAAAAAVPG